MELVVIGRLGANLVPTTALLWSILQAWRHPFVFRLISHRSRDRSPHGPPGTRAHGSLGLRTMVKSHFHMPRLQSPRVRRLQSGQLLWSSYGLDGAGQVWGLGVENSKG